MVVSVEWHNPEKTALRFTLDGILRLEELMEATVIGDAMLDTVDHPVVVVFDYTNVSMMAVGTLSQLRPNLVQHHRNTGSLVLLIGLNTLLRTIAGIVFRIYPNFYEGREVRMLHTLEEADALIRARHAGFSV